MVIWQDKIGEHVKSIIDIDQMAELFRKKIKQNISDLCPPRYAERKATNEMIEILAEKGMENNDIVHFLHFCEATPYSGCGCCEHRKKLTIT